MKQIEVLQIIAGFAIEGPLGGIERFGIELAKALVTSTSIKPTLCGMWDYETPYEAERLRQLQSEKIESFMPAVWRETNPYRSFWNAWQGCRHYLQHKSFDIIHSHCQFGDVLALLLKWEFGISVAVRTVHNEREWGKRPLRNMLLTNGLYPLLFQQELGVSQQVVANLNRRPIAKKLKRTAVCAYNALNIDRFAHLTVNKNEKRRTLGLSPSTHIVGTVGRLTPQKAYDLFLEAAAIIAGQTDNIHFLIIGDGPLAPDLQTQAEKLDLTQKVTFTGARTDVEELLQIMDCFVSSSRWEGLPTVILESMMSRVPVVATDVSGNRELVQDGVNGRLVPPDDPIALAQAVLETIHLTEATTQKLTQSAFELVSENFSITQIAAQHEALYTKLLN